MGFGSAYANALVLILLDGIIFIVLVVTGLRRKIFAAIPKSLRSAVSAGIGLFIAFLGLQNSGIIVADVSTGVALGSFNIISGEWASVRSIDWDSIEIAVPAFLTMTMIPFAYNISYGIAFGLIAYVFIHLCAGRKKQIKPATWVLTILFITLLLVHGI